MYNQFSQFATEVYRSYFGHVAFRQRFKGRKDAFFELHLAEDSQADQQILKRLSMSIGQISQMCFKQCVETNYKIFTTEEEACIRRCTKDYFKGYEKIAFYTHKSLNQD